MSAMRVSDVIRLIVEVGDSYRLAIKGRHILQRVNLGKEKTEYNYYQVWEKARSNNICIAVKKNDKMEITESGARQGVLSVLMLLERIGIVNDLEQNQDDEAQALISDAKELLINQQREKIINPLWKSTKESIAPKDNVNNPSHYTQGNIECIDAMESMLTPEEFRGFLRGSIFKYQWRFMQKNGVEGLKKSQWYLNKLIEKLEDMK